MALSCGLVAWHVIVKEKLFELIPLYSDLYFGGGGDHVKKLLF